MRTRRQLQQVKNKKDSSKSKSKKPTKAQLMKQKAEAQKLKKGKSVGAKKAKVQVSVSVDNNSVKAKALVSVKAMKKEKQVRVKKTSPPTQVTRSLSKSKVTVVKEVKITKKAVSKEAGQKAMKQTKPGKSVDTKQQTKSKKQSSPQPLPRKKPEGQSKKDEQKKQNVKTMIMKGKVPIDDLFPLRKQDYHVLQQGGKVYSATLNQTNVLNNNNKFYMIQILQNDSNGAICYLFTRWGRVGQSGQISNQGPMNTMSAILEYNKKYHQKAVKGDYREIQLNYENEDQKKDETKKDDNQNNENSKVQIKQSKLPKQVQSLVELIFDINMMNKQMVQIGYNVDKMPLGKLSKDNIKKGYGILKQLYEQIKGKNRRGQVVKLTDDFYSYIPHDFGYQKMQNFILDTQQKVKQKIQMLESLAQIKVATTLLSQAKKDQNKIDSNYAKLNRDINPVDRDSTQFKTINDYLQTTHGRHHTSYTLQIVDLFRVSSDMENTRYMKDIHNKKLLWHGSRLTNFVGILSQGLRIAPPEAPVTGYMFGKGVYFADMSSKSANYCFTSRDNNTGILLLCEVALGNMNEKTHADYYAANLPPNKHSTKGVGKIQPDPKNAVELEKGVQIPMGPGVQSNDPAIYLRYNQFIVYDIAQIKIKYLLRTKFNYVNNFGFGF